MIFSPYCDNPESMVIKDVLTGIIYTQDEALRTNKIIKSRLVNCCLKQGYEVLTLKECNDLLNNRRLSGEDICEWMSLEESENK